MIAGATPHSAPTIGAMNRKLWESLASLYGVHAFNYLIPLLTLPYLARVLGPAEWGAFAFADAYGRFVGADGGIRLRTSRRPERSRASVTIRTREAASSPGSWRAASSRCFAALITWILANTVPVFAAHRRLLPGAFFWR